MTETNGRILFWVPRVLCVLFAVFLGMFAADAFGPGQGFWTSVGAFLLHLVPSAVVLAVLAISWRREWIGGIVFLGLGVYYIVTAWGRFHWSAYLVIAGPLFLLAALFFLNWWLLPRTRPVRT